MFQSLSLKEKPRWKNFRPISFYRHPFRVSKVEQLIDESISFLPIRASIINYLTSCPRSLSLRFSWSGNFFGGGRGCLFQAHKPWLLQRGGPRKQSKVPPMTPWIVHELLFSISTLLILWLLLAGGETEASLAWERLFHLEPLWNTDSGHGKSRFKRQRHAKARIEREGEKEKELACQSQVLLSQSFHEISFPCGQIVLRVRGRKTSEHPSSVKGIWWYRCCSCHQ